MEKKIGADVGKIMAENVRRHGVINAPFNPVSGEGSVGEREEVVIDDFMGGRSLWLPTPMVNTSELWQRVLDARTIKDFIAVQGWEYSEEERVKVAEALIRSRMRHDFPFYCASFVKIKPKGGGDDVPFVLNRPQRTILIPAFEKSRLGRMPIREIVLKARQWGGSTATQQYDGWMQTTLAVGLNSLIVGHVSAASVEVEDMFKKMLDNFPTKMLYPMGASYSEKEPKFASVFGHPNIHRIPQRNCKIKIGTAENPNSCRGGDYNLVHCTEVGLWRKTDGKSPEDIIDSATSGILYKEGTSIVYESTAKGTGNFFHREYVAASEGKSQFHAVFVPWYEIDTYSLDFRSEAERASFARWLWVNRGNPNAETDRAESGVYYWTLWNRGATLEALHWYREERRKYSDHGHMASEYPSDDIEAFTYSGVHVFDRYLVETFREGCRARAAVVGDLAAKGIRGAEALENIVFTQDKTRSLQVWEMPDIDADNPMANRYVVSVDIGSRSNKSDWSVITVIDRYWMMEGDKPVVVAQMRYHCDHDILAWDAARIARWYDNALLVFESNTLESRDAVSDGDTTLFILEQVRNVYDNLYARKQSAEDIKEGIPKKYGYHTNRKTKPSLIANLVRLIREHGYVERDERVLDELLQYEYKPNGGTGAMDGYHDDMVMSRAIGLYVSEFEMDLPTFVKTGSFKGLAQEVVSEATI